MLRSIPDSVLRFCVVVLAAAVAVLWLASGAGADATNSLTTPSTNSVNVSTICRGPNPVLISCSGASTKAIHVYVTDGGTGKSTVAFGGSSLTYPTAAVLRGPGAEYTRNASNLWCKSQTDGGVAVIADCMR